MVVSLLVATSIFMMIKVLVVSSSPTMKKPLLISTKRFIDHSSKSYHPESPDRSKALHSMAEHLHEQGKVNLVLPSAETNHNRLLEAEQIIKSVHTEEYVNRIKLLCERGASRTSPWDADTYLSKHTYHICLLAQSAWMDAVDEAIQNKNVAFSLSRPPGHHAIKNESMGFCIFNFAVGAAQYALQKYNLTRISMLDFDVHYGNGIADLISSNQRIRYSSLHQLGVFPSGGDESYTGPLHNIKNVAVPYGATWETYSPLLERHAISFLRDFDPELLIVSAGYDALASDELANIQLMPKDYQRIAALIKENFKIVALGLEGGYNIHDLPIAVEATLQPFYAE